MRRPAAGAVCWCAVHKLGGHLLRRIWLLARRDEGAYPSAVCDRRATKPQANCHATLRAAVLFGADFVARFSRINLDMLVARASSAPKIPCRKRGRIYETGYLVPR